jgi:hypothetical protein
MVLVNHHDIAEEFAARRAKFPARGFRPAQNVLQPWRVQQTGHTAMRSKVVPLDVDLDLSVENVDVLRHLRGVFFRHRRGDAFRGVRRYPCTVIAHQLFGDLRKPASIASTADPAFTKSKRVRALGSCGQHRIDQNCSPASRAFSSMWWQIGTVRAPRRALGRRILRNPCHGVACCPITTPAHGSYRMNQ